MSNIAKLIRDLKEKGIGLTVSGNDLEVSIFKEGIDPRIFDVIREHKAGIKEYIQAFDFNFKHAGIPVTAPADSYPISDAQRRLWVWSQFEDASVSYNMPRQMSLSSELHLESFRKAIDATIERHEILRTVFRENEAGEIRQWVLRTGDLGFKIDYKDLRAEFHKEEKLKQYIHEDANGLFDLEKGPLLRAALLQVQDEEYVFYYNMHHIIADGWSMDVLTADVLAFYEAYTQNKVPQLKELGMQYKDYSAWQLARLNEESFKTHRDYWLENLAGELPLLDLPSFKRRPEVKTHNGRTVITYLSKEATRRLNTYVLEREGTLFMGVMAVLKALLFRYTGQHDLIVGMQVAGRDHPDLEDQIGFYVNSLALRSKLGEEDSFDEVYQKVRHTILNAYTHQMYPFDRLVEELEQIRLVSRSAVFDITAILQNTGEKIEHVIIPDDQTDAIVEFSGGTSNYDVKLDFREEGDYLRILVEYNKDVYEGEMIEGFIRHFKNFTAAALSDPSQQVAAINYLSKEEEQQLLVSLNESEGGFSADKTIVDLFEEQAARTPDHIAVVFEKNRLTYRELNELSDRLAHYLRENYTVKPEELVGIQLERSHWMIVAILGVLKAGGAYVPIDPDYPSSRKEHIVKDACLKLLVTDTNFDHENNYFKGEVFAIDRGFDSETYAEKQHSGSITSGNSAYVIYTSGSTGLPKGVVIEHGAVVNTLLSAIGFFEINSNTKGLQFASFSFDASVWETFIILLSGGSLAIIGGRDRNDPELLAEFITTHKIDLATLPPSYLNRIRKESLKGIKTLITAGESASYQRAVDHLKFGTYYNAYGPTEASICASIFKLTDRADLLTDNIPIGKPISNARIYILNREHKLQPPGVIGEICIGGAGLARGYLNKEELTREKFVASPFHKGERLYKTGDLGRWLPDGNIEFIGRKDEQVKIRGYRIELGEIEQALRAYSSLEDAVVIARENPGKEKELVAYITSKEEQNTEDLRTWLKGLIPEYMLPEHYVQLEAMPLTTNGKINKKLLPDPEGLGISSGVEYIAPGNEVEEKLAGLWAGILGKEKETISIDEGFFTLGGNSIELIALKSRIEKEFKTKLQIASLFKYTTVRQQAEMLLQETEAKKPVAEETDGLPVVRETDSKQEDPDIAVIGMALKVPGAKNVYEFWENLRAGKESILHFSREELLAAGVHETTLNDPDYVRANSYLEEKECFDAGFFGYLPDEARLMDPQTRVFHEMVWSALEDSGYDPLSYKGLIGLHAGAGSNVNWEAYSQIVNEGRTDEFTANQLRDKDFSSGLIAHKLGLKGPVNSISTACSTSLVAIHQAARSLLSGESHMAVAGGVSIRSKRKEEGYIYKEGMIVSNDGHNRAFDAASNGTVGGEGAGAVVLKRLSEAIKDGDHIYAVIKGSAVNNDGNRKVGFTAPSVDGQSEVIRLAHKAANISAESISYVEAHGTATKLGDPIEVLALTQAFGKSADKYCALGSVKTNIGHLDAAAGVTGFIKAALCLEHKELVPSLFFGSPNPEINFEEGPFYVNTELKKWQKGNTPRRAGVSSFGIGGTNAHIIMEEAPARQTNVQDSFMHLIPLSARTSGALARQRDNLVDFLKANREIRLADVAWTLQNRRTFPYKAAVVARTLDEAIRSLETAVTKKTQNTGVQGQGRKIAFLFPGGGAQYQNMARDLYEVKESVFRKTMDRCFEAAQKLSAVNFKHMLYPGGAADAEQVNEIMNALPVLFMVEYALARQIEYYGIRPDIMIGHSMGEYVAACFAGVLSIEGALTMVIKRAELMQGLPRGSMLAVEIPADKIKDHLSNEVDLAAVNSPTGCVLSGNTGAIEALLKQFEDEGVPAKLLHISHAAHSSMMDPILDTFTKAIKEVSIQAPKIPYISNLTGLRITAKELNDRAYWSAHIRNTVKFSSGIREILSQENIVFIEVGPGHALSNFTRHHFNKDASAEVHQLIRHSQAEEHDVEFLLRRIADLWRSGVDLNWSHVHTAQIKHRISLPAYPFERTKYPIGEDVVSMISQKLGQLNEEQRLDESEWYYEPTWRRAKLLQEPVSRKKEDEWYLVFSDEGSFLKDQVLPGIASNRMILVRQGAKYKRTRDYEFELDPFEYGGYEKLFVELNTKKIHPAHIVHAWCFDQRDSVAGRQENDKTLGYYSLLHIAKELNKLEDQLPVNLSVLTSCLEPVFNEDTIEPARSLISGLLIVISQENPCIRGRLIDLSAEDGENTIKDLIRELRSGVQDKYIAYRHTMRWVKDFSRMTIPPVEVNGSRIRQRGTYLITGGLGGLAFTYAKYLLEKYKVNLVLVGRSEISSSLGSKDQEKRTRLETLRAMGNVSYYAAGVSDLAAMRNAVQKGELLFGEINGVIHTAALLEGDSLSGISFLQPADCEKQFDPKIKGVQVLEELFRNRELDFCLLTSSLASIIGGKEFGSYAPANSYMDYFSFTGRIRNCISVNFGSLYFNEDITPGSYQPDALHPQHMTHVLEKVLSAGSPQVLVSPTSLEYRIKKWVYPKPDTKLPVIETYSAPEEQESADVSAGYAPPESATEKELCSLFEAFFGSARIGIDDNFFELGGDSLKAMTLISRIHKKFNVLLKIKDIFAEADVRNLSRRIDALAGMSEMKQKRSKMNFENKIEI